MSLDRSLPAFSFLQLGVLHPTPHSKKTLPVRQTAPPLRTQPSSVPNAPRRIVPILCASCFWDSSLQCLCTQPQLSMPSTPSQPRSLPATWALPPNLPYFPLSDSLMKPRLISYHTDEAGSVSIASITYRCEPSPTSTSPASALQPPLTALPVPSSRL